MVLALRFDIEIWGPLADVAAGELAKGDMVQVLGRLRSNEYVTREGVKQKSMRVAVNNINRVRPYAPDQARSPVRISPPSPVLPVASGTPLLYGGWGARLRVQSWDAMASQVQAEQPLYEDQTAGMPGWGAETPLQQPQATKAGTLAGWSLVYLARSSWPSSIHMYLPRHLCFVGPAGRQGAAVGPSAQELQRGAALLGSCCLASCSSVRSAVIEVLCNAVLRQPRNQAEPQGT